MLDMTCKSYAKYFVNTTDEDDNVVEFTEVTSCHTYWEYFNFTTMMQCLTECANDTLMFGYQCVTTCPAPFIPSGNECVNAN
jgi:hypothetical protein